MRLRKQNSLKCGYLDRLVEALLPGNLPAGGGLRGSVGVDGISCGGSVGVDTVGGGASRLRSVVAVADSFLDSGALLLRRGGALLVHNFLASVLVLGLVHGFQLGGASRLNIRPS